MSVLDVCVFVMIKPTEWGNSIFVCLSMGIPTDVIFLLHFQGVGGGGGYSIKFNMGKLLPEVRTLNLLYTLSEGKGTPFVYLLLTNGNPFT